MNFVETCKIRWDKGTFTVKTYTAGTLQVPMITYQYTVRSGTQVIERNTTNKFGEVIKRLLYFKGL